MINFTYVRFAVLIFQIKEIKSKKYNYKATYFTYLFVNFTYSRLHESIVSTHFLPKRIFCYLATKWVKKATKYRSTVTHFACPWQITLQAPHNLLPINAFCNQITKPGDSIDGMYSIHAFVSMISCLA